MRFTCELSAQHKQALEALVEDDGESQSAIVRGLIRDEARRRGLWPTKEARTRGTPPRVP